MTEHTPGPWEVTHIYPDSDQKYYDWCGQVVSKGPYICTIKQAGAREEAEAMANMHIIAAGPDLLAALAEAADKLHVFGCNFPTGGPDQIAAFAARDQARAAIAKAKGQT